MKMEEIIKTILIVESPNDAAFYKKLCFLATKGTKEGVNHVDIIEFEDLHNFDYDGTNQRGYSLSSLTAKLDTIKRQLSKSKYKDVNHIAVIVDTDFPSNGKQKPNQKQDGGKENRLYQVSEAIK